MQIMVFSYSSKYFLKNIEYVTLTVVTMSPYTSINFLLILKVVLRNGNQYMRNGTSLKTICQIHQKKTSTRAVFKACCAFSSCSQVARSVPCDLCRHRGADRSIYAGLLAATADLATFMALQDHHNHTDT